LYNNAVAKYTGAPDYGYGTYCGACPS